LLQNELLVTTKTKRLELITQIKGIQDESQRNQLIEQNITTLNQNKKTKEDEVEEINTRIKVLQEIINRLK
jgi:predicted  nucleic acid-binding Zn-ribbon protein